MQCPGAPFLAMLRREYKFRCHSDAGRATGVPPAIPQTVGLWDGACLEPVSRAKVYRVQENRKSLPARVVLTGDCMLEQFALDVLGQLLQIAVTDFPSASMSEPTPSSTSPACSSGRRNGDTVPGSQLLQAGARMISNRLLPMIAVAHGRSCELKSPGTIPMLSVRSPASFGLMSGPPATSSPAHSSERPARARIRGASPGTSW